MKFYILDSHDIWACVVLTYLLDTYLISCLQFLIFYLAKSVSVFLNIKGFLIKFMFSKKVTKIDKIFTVDLTLFSKCQIDGEDFVNVCGLLRKHELYLHRLRIIISAKIFKYCRLAKIPAIYLALISFFVAIM